MKLDNKKRNTFSNANWNDLAKISDKLPGASFLFVTYNRCPFPDFLKNPLTWAFQTLISNNCFNLIDDLVVIDDGSTDFTSKNIKWLEKTYGLKINYYKNNARRDLSYSRGIGIKKTKNNLVFMGDDDCLYSNNFILGSMATYYFLSRKVTKNIAVINFPVFERCTYPKETTPINQIGKVFYNKTFFCYNFDKFPEEYMNNPKYLQNKNLLMPFEVDTFAGVNLCDKSLILKAGNYLDLSAWGSGYSEHIELSRALTKHGFYIYHQPDPRISCVHLKYGANSRDKFDRRLSNKIINGVKYRLGELVDFSKKENLNTGTRQNNNNFHIIEIGSLFSFYLKISKKLGIKFAAKEYINFVNKKLLFSTTPSCVIESKKQREKIWKTAIQRGCEITAIQTKKDYSSVFNKIINEVNQYV
ncbi:MAG: glycosyltransferase [Candidatus Berkelbacteria bacterium]|nr:glycosyltransferase [Candidatus Berkelbacteria bacterium]